MLNRGARFERARNPINRVPDHFPLRCQGCLKMFTADQVKPVWVHHKGMTFLGGLCSDCWATFEFQEAVKNAEP